MDSAQQQATRLWTMPGRAREAPHRATGEQTIIRSPVSALFWRVFLLNGLVFVRRRHRARALAGHRVGAGGGA